jgi:hypothetical protein
MRTNIGLYDITADPGETTNLTEDNQEIVDSMTKQLVGWWETMRALE